jgi:glycine dehydrogenase subunit 2
MINASSATPSTLPQGHDVRATDVKIVEPTIFDLSSPGRTGVTMPASDVPESALPPKELLRSELPLPELAEVDVVRHYMHLSSFNYSVDSGYYPLGSCTMKYNPKINEDTCRLPGFLFTHPLQPIETVQGNLALMFQLQEWLKEIAGFAAVTLQPAAGAHGEFTGVLMMHAYHKSRGDDKRVKMLIPDAAHGTNPASVGMMGMTVVTIPSDKRGNVDLKALEEACDDTVVGMMLTNPNTLGLFDENVEKVIELVHGCGGLMYGDGANLNALLGIVRPGDLGFDVMHFNLHKTFSVPHGGGGPGVGPVGVAAHLADFLPEPLVGRARGVLGRRSKRHRHCHSLRAAGRAARAHRALRSRGRDLRGTRLAHGPVQGPLREPHRRAYHHRGPRRCGRLRRTVGGGRSVAGHGEAHGA